MLIPPEIDLTKNKTFSAFGRHNLVTVENLRTPGEANDDLFHSDPHFRNAACQYESPTETVHESDLYVGSFHGAVSSGHNGFPRSEMDEPDSFACVILAFMCSDMKAEVLIDTRIGRIQDMSKTHFFARDAHPGHTKGLSLELFVILTEDPLQKLFSRDLLRSFHI